ncbi:FHA domain-containing protein [Microterricola gilva]|uniref:FHA domain-containing protein n=1 Tax=Microterricola gilva TaxID=393267 RepID=A0A4Q8AJ39_9MICO|nr:FHA domain-containing protein [Microterricola gilva]RZU64500.1 FHA domain-containing protein [Microterricola gilva]
MSAPRWRAVPAAFGQDPAALWRYVIAMHWVAAVPASTDPAVVHALLRLREDATTTLERVVGAVPLGGEHAVEDFAAVELVAAPSAASGADTTASVIVRGRASVDVFGPGGSRRHESRGIRPWLLADFREVTALSFTVADVGAIAASELPPPGASASVDGDGQWAEQGGAQQGAALSGRRLDLVLGVPGESGEHAGGARLLPEGQAAAVHRMRVAGEIFTLDVESYIGRRPRATPLTQSTARLVTVPSPAQEVSATHALVSQHNDDVVVTDLKSTNGTLVELPDGSQLRLRAMVATVIPPGSRILLGDGVVVELLDPAEDGWARGR